jgi:hypothetical protein
MSGINGQPGRRAGHSVLTAATLSLSFHSSIYKLSEKIMYSYGTSQDVQFKRGGGGGSMPLTVVKVNMFLLQFTPLQENRQKFSNIASRWYRGKWYKDYAVNPKILLQFGEYSSKALCW